MEHTHLLKPSRKKQLHSIHMCRENEFQPKFTRRGVTSAVCTGWGFKAILRWLQSVHHQMKNLSKTHYCTYFKCGTIATADCPLIGPSTNQREVRLGNWQKVLCTVLLITGQHCSVVLITWTAKASSVQYSTVQICWILPCTAVSTHIAIISLLAVSSDFI